MASEVGSSDGGEAALAPLHHAVSLPSIDELNIHDNLLLLGQAMSSDSHNTKHGSHRGRVGRHRRVKSSVTTLPSSFGSSPRSSGSTHSDISSLTTAVADYLVSKSMSPKSSHSRIHSATSVTSLDNNNVAAFQVSTQLLQNMMRTHKNRNPYKDYVVLGMIGKGSIGSVEKVVRRHHSVLQHGNDDLEDDATCGNGGVCGGVFGDCWRGGKSDRKKIRSGNNGCCWSWFGRLFNNSQDVFQSTTSTDTNQSSSNLDKHRSSDHQQSDTSIVSESSAFSAPTTPLLTKRRNMSPSASSSNRSEMRASSMHGNIILSSQLYGNSSLHTNPGSVHHHAQHPLRKYALKSIRLDRTKKKHKRSSAPAGISSSDEAELRNEISILRSLDHPHIVHIIETYEYKSMIYMVIDLCENGDLYVLDPYSEGEARGIMRQLLQAVSYMHHRGIVHRDLKYENVMFSERGNGRSKLQIKLIDFGLSMKYGKKKGQFDLSKEMTDFVGTIYTMAPEVIRGNYTYKCDIWSLGVMAYMLLSSQIPFCGNNMKEIARKIMFSDHSYSGKRWSKISQEGKEFVSSLLVRDVASRPTADHALKHPWVAGGKPSYNSLSRRHSSGSIGGTAHTSSERQLQKPLDADICISIENYSAYSWMHRLALMVIAYRYTGSETTHLRRIFTSYDADNSGTVEVDELRGAFALHDKYTNEEINEIFLAMDMNGSGKISWTEFLAATIETKGHISLEEFESAFDHLDLDKSGYISTSNLREIIGRDLPQSIIDKIIDESDITRDHKIWKDEFLALGEESNVGIDTQQQHQNKGVRVYLKRSKSADDFDMVKTSSLEGMYSDTNEVGTDQFGIQKAKSVRKITHQFV